ncbi:hypothetical protein [Aneurinibacillus aneurinilyticus]
MDNFTKKELILMKSLANGSKKSNEKKDCFSISIIHFLILSQ